MELNFSNIPREKDIRVVKPKLLYSQTVKEIPWSLLYQLYSSRRPEQMKSDFAVNNTKRANFSKPWFKETPTESYNDV